MTATIDQKAYLAKYLGGPSGDKKKKKKKAVKGKGFKIIDDDIDLSKLRPLDGDELDILDGGEDAPQIAGIIDERPEELRKQEEFGSSSKWRVISQDDGFNSKLQVQEIKRDIKETKKENEIIFGKMYSDSEDEKQDSDASPPRKGSGNKNGERKEQKASKKHNSDSDFSPPSRKEKGDSPKRKREKIYDLDPSPSRTKSDPKERVRKPSRWGDVDRDKSPGTSKSSKRRSPSSDQLPPRKSHKNHDSDASPPRKTHKKYNSDASPPRKSQKKYDSDASPPRKSHKKYDSDASPPRKTQKKYNSDASPPRKSRKESSRRNRSPENTNRKRRKSVDSDLSPPRKSNHKSRKSPEKRNIYECDSDASPPRRENKKDKRYQSNDSPPPSNKKMAKTLEGKKAGLQDAKQLREENESFRKREEDVYNKMTDEVSGRNAQAVSRKGKRDNSEERQKQREKAERQKELDEKYKKWSKGIKQIEDQQSRVQEFMHEASKPLARHKDDRDLEHNLKQIERDGDPMLQYMREKKRERGELGPERPTYKGNFPPNRFNLRPGYRWDGVDRSNGYEKKYFTQQSKKKAQEEEAYKWSTEDL